MIVIPLHRKAGQNAHMNTTLPACLSDLQQHWPFADSVPGARLFSSRFDHTLLTANDFLQCGIVPPESIQRSVAKRQAEYLAGRLCTRSALFALTGDGQVPAIGADRAPVWPAHTVGSITHGSGWAAAVVASTSDCQGLGLDIESLLPPARAERLASEILTPAERTRMDPTHTHAVVTLTFSLKESLFKALYPLVGKRFYFEHAEVLHWSAQGHARLRLLTDLSERFGHGFEIDAQFAWLDEHLLSLVAVR
jgi:enterobactin synthetase component D